MLFLQNFPRPLNYLNQKLMKISFEIEINHILIFTEECEESEKGFLKFKKFIKLIFT